MSRQRDLRPFLCFALLVGCLLSTTAAGNDQAPSPTEEERALALLRGAGGWPDAVFSLEPWPHGPRPNLLVAAASPQQGNTIAVALFSRSEGGLRLLTVRELEDGRDFHSHFSENPWVVLDRAHYQVSPTESALALRYQTSYSSTSLGRSADTLILLRWVRGSLVPILSATMNWGETENPGMNEDIDAEPKVSGDDRILVLSQTSHQGFYDIAIRSRNTRRQWTYIWNGHRYEKTKTTSRNPRPRPINEANAPKR